jgi:hypothetical protein
MDGKDKRFYMNELKSAQCFCEQPKKPGRAFCYNCFKALPRELKSDLYLPIGGGYEAAYDEAVEYLTV